MKKMPHSEREADVTAIISPGSRLCALRTDYLAAPDRGRAARGATSWPRAPTPGRLGDYGEI
jgi:hypothetical protein